MRRLLAATILLSCVALPAPGQVRVSTPQPRQDYRFETEAIARQEWTTKKFLGPDENRWRLRLLPKIEIGRTWLFAGVGGDFNYSKDKNTEGILETGTYADNYESRGARLDLAYLRLQPVAWLRVEGGRFAMPVGLTGMLWDPDLRPQGGALTLQYSGQRELTRLALTALGARGSHVFKDEKTDMLLISGTAAIAGGRTSQLDFTASFLQFTGFDKPDGLDRRLFRQNASVAAGLVDRYRVVDLIGRVRGEGEAPVEIYADYCWNTELKKDNSGFWTGIILGSLVTSRGRMEYTYARVGREATLGAYAADDFLWFTGWEGHRGELATRTGQTSSFHVIGQLQRLRSASNPEEARHWVRRIRLEWRIRTLR
jgi:hypothetical protein